MTDTTEKLTEPTKADQDRLLHFRPIEPMSISDMTPAKINDEVYRPLTEDDPAIQQLAADIELNGLIDPIVVTLDNVIVSGHRRHMACQIAGLDQVPTQQLQLFSDDPRFVPMLVSCNMQREKSRDEQVREEVISSDPAEAYQALLSHRQEVAEISAETIQLRGRRKRKTIGRLKQQMVDAVVAIVYERQQYWPISVRSIHYAILNLEPLRNITRRVPYINDVPSYKDATDICCRMRLEGLIPFHSISDETRPVYEWDVHTSPKLFMQRELDALLKGYRRDLQQSQPNHIEIVVEKNTVIPILKSVAARYGITMTSGRGYASLDPRYKMAQRFEASGRENLIVVVVSDFDPEGEDIPESFARSMRDDFGIESVQCVKAALTHAQVQSHDLPSSLDAKATSSRYKRFVAQYGTRAVELEALPPETLQGLLTDAIDSVIDVEAFNAELNSEKQDAAFLQDTRCDFKRKLSEAGQ